MKVLLYISAGSDSNNRFINIFGKIIPSHYTEIYNHLDDLSVRLMKATKETLDQTYKLFSRYICTINNQYDELSLIIKKMTKDLSIHHKGE